MGMPQTGHQSDNKKRAQKGHRGHKGQTDPQEGKPTQDREMSHRSPESICQCKTDPEVTEHPKKIQWVPVTRAISRPPPYMGIGLRAPGEKTRKEPPHRVKGHHQIDNEPARHSSPGISKERIYTQYDRFHMLKTKSYEITQKNT